MSTPSAAVAAPPSTRGRLLAGARAIVTRDGYGAATVVAIAGEAGVATGTLYRHFASREALVVELFRDVCAGEERAMRAAGDAHGSEGGGVGWLVRVLEAFAQRALTNPRLAWALLAEPVGPALDAERLAFRARYAALLAGGVRRAVARGDVPAQDEAFTAAALVGGCGEALVGPLAAGRTAGVDGRERAAVLDALGAWVPRAVGAGG